MVSLMKRESEDNNLDYLRFFFFWLKLQWIFKVCVRNSYDENNKNPLETVSKRGFLVCLIPFNQSYWSCQCLSQSPETIIG